MAPLGELFPDGGLRPGTVVALGWASGSTTLLLRILAGPLAGGSWGAVVGIPALGLEAAAGLGVDLERLVMVPRPAPPGHLPGEAGPGTGQPGATWLEVVATLLSSLDLVALRPPGRCRAAEARRLAARAREGGGVLLLAAPARAWPEPVDIELAVTGTAWHGLGAGYGTLGYRTIDVVSSGRRGASRPRRASLRVGVHFAQQYVCSII